MINLRLGLGFDFNGSSSPPPPPLILDTLSAAAAYSLRLLRTAYTGFCIRVRRSSDNTEQNIGFVGGVLDTSALLAFVGGGSGFVVTWYDQSVNAKNATQATAASQPMVVNAGVLNVDNGKVAITFNGSYALNVGSLAIFSGFAVAKRSGNFQTLTELSGAGDSRGWTNTAAGSQFEVWTTQYINGSVQASILNSQYVTSGFRVASFAAPGVVLGNLVVRGFEPLTGSLQEIIYFSDNQNSNRQSIERNQGTYYGVTVA